MAEAPGKHVVKSVGAAVLAAMSYAGGMALLMLESVTALGRDLFSAKALQAFAAATAQLVRVGVRSVPIVLLVQGFIGVILSLQMAPPLQPWGQLDKIASVIGVAGFRFLGPIITGVVISGFGGASIAAELGTMVVSEEIEALRAMALNPIRFLVVPRILATFAAMVLLTIMADVMIALGGYAAARFALPSAAYATYWKTMHDTLAYHDLWAGLIMAAVFGLLISLIACYEGLNVSGGAEGVGRATTNTVVKSIVAIIGSACVFTMVFYVYGW
ncbi:MAG: ABC transporter permease [Planctomycetaceae bacterium]|nr:ABC transporter permease [Planctomycetaceae bacterium]